MAKKRRAFEQGHTRKLLVIIDETAEAYCALFYAARGVQHAGGRIQLLYVIERENQFWGQVRQAELEEQTNKARALFRLFRRELNNQGFGGVVTEEVIRDGKKAEEILKQIDEDEEVSALVLGTSIEAGGHVPLVAAFTGGPMGSRFPIPVTIVPGDSAIEDIKAIEPRCDGVREGAQAGNLCVSPTSTSIKSWGSSVCR